MVLEDRLGKEGLAIATGNRVVVYAYGGATMTLAKRSGPVRTLALHNGTLTDGGDYDGIRDTKSGVTVCGEGHDWRAITSGAFSTSWHGADYEPKIYGSIQNSDEKHRGLFSMRLGEPGAYYLRTSDIGMHHLSTIPVLGSFGNRLIAAPSVIPYWGHLGEPIDPRQYPGFFLNKPLAVYQKLRSFYVDEAPELQLVTHRITSFGAGEESVFVGRYDGVWASAPRIHQEAGVKYGRFVRMAEPDAPIAQWTCALGAIMHRQLCGDNAAKKLLESHIERAPEQFTLEPGTSLRHSRAFGEVYLAALASEAINGVTLAEDRLWYGDERGVLRSVSFGGGPSRMMKRFREPIRAMVTLPEEFVDGGLRQQLTRGIQMRAMHAGMHARPVRLLRVA